MSWPCLIAFHILGYAITFSISITGYLSVTDEQTTNNLLAALSPEILANKGPRTPIFFLAVDSPVVFYGVLYIFVMFLVSIVLGFFMAIHIILYLRKHASNFTAKTYRMHLQLTVILIVQQITPIVFIITPIVTIIAIAIRNGGSVYISKTAFSVVVALATFYPMTNAAICIVFITPYWNFTKEWVFWILYKLHIIKKTTVDNQKIVVLNSAISSMTYAG